MYWAGLTQSLMWKEFTAEGFLQYPNFLETVIQIVPMYITRSIGGTLFLTGTCIGAWNLYKTAVAGSLLADEKAEAPALEKEYKKVEGAHWHHWLEGKAVHFVAWTTVAILIGGAVEMIPLYVVESNVPTIASVKPYTPLELEGRDLYIREGYNHSH